MFGLKFISLDSLISNHVVKSILEPTLITRKCKRLTDMYVIYKNHKLNIDYRLKKLINNKTLYSYIETLDWGDKLNIKPEIKMATQETIVNGIIKRLKNYYNHNKKLINKKEIQKFLNYLLK